MQSLWNKRRERYGGGEQVDSSSKLSFFFLVGRIAIGTTGRTSIRGAWATRWANDSSVDFRRDA
eukprot:scaffold2908_cov257-Pinguiococcus_pyrenoidosus.AAC.4